MAKYKITIEIDVDEKDVEMFYWEHNTNSFAEEKDPSLIGKAPGYQNFKDIQDQYELFMQDDFKDFFEILEKHPGITKINMSQHRIDKGKAMLTRKIHKR